MLDGYADRQRVVMQRTAWAVSHLLIAAGCDAKKVTVAKLLGEDEPKGKQVIPDDVRRKMDAEKLWAKLQKKRLESGE